MQSDEMIELNKKLICEAVGGFGTETKHRSHGMLVRDRQATAVHYKPGKAFPWTLRFYTGEEMIPQDLVLRHCSVCGTAFTIETYHGLVDEAYALPCSMDKDELAVARKAYSALRKCSLHARAGHSITVQRNQNFVFWLANLLRSQGFAVVKGKARPGELDWHTLFNRRFSLLKRPSVPDVLPWELPDMDWQQAHGRIVEDSFGIARDEATRAEIVEKPFDAELLDEKDSERFYKEMAEIDDAYEEDGIRSLVHRAPSVGKEEATLRYHLSVQDRENREFAKETASLVCEINKARR